ncbi:MAG: phosphoenolpyruvate carboxylase [Chloroflexi bacterium]|nr:phosphoenolpyruvate carboxylase [Chloroflexota bacterium]MCC6894994.1 phosphoenolpyruvate carboxylase [Anaerolineae bacterium]
MSIETDKTATREMLNPLSNDIRLLGNLLGNVIREQHGEAAFELVEKVRATAKARRSGEKGATAELTKIVGGVDLEQTRVLIKAFGNYFQLINIAEDLQRIRVLRQRELDGRMSESIDDAVHKLHADGLTADGMKALLEKISIRLVLTAHPSEAKRKEVLIKLQHIANLMAERDRQMLLPREQQAVENEITAEIEELWQTRPTRASRATVADEVDFGVYFVTSTIMDTVVDIYEDLSACLARYYPDTDWSDLPMLLRYASWIGGDRDGNPNVTPEVTMETLRTQHLAALRVYTDEVNFLSQHLTQSSDEVPVSDDLREAVTAAGGLDERFPTEFYRQQINLISGRLARDEYQNSLDLYDDLALIEASLRHNKGRHTASGALSRLMEKVRLFGLYLAPLDVREDARMHASALEEIFKQYGRTESYKGLSEADKQTLLTMEISNPRPLFPAELKFSDATNKIISTWRMVAQAHKQYGKAVIDTFIASMSQQPSDILAMLLLAHEVGIEDDIDIVPLFETIDDLQNAPQVMTALFANAAYSKHLKVRGNHQQVMIGYSDSGKDGGYMASNWNLYTAQHDLAEICEAHGISLELFHGRGGSIGRGGGPTNQAILSQPPLSMQGKIKITEQGEVIAYRYSNADIARRHMHHVINAVMLVTGKPSDHDVKPEWREVMDFLAATGRKAFRKFVYETEGFLQYWHQATPINELANLPISSRPAKRKSGGSFSDVRAIPWVFSWMQSRAIIPSWYSVGTALKQYCDEHENGMDTLRTMYAEWPFFKALMENAQLDLAKADMGIAELYASLVSDETLREGIFNEMKQEYTLACEYVCQVFDEPALLQKSPVMQRSIERRNPYVDPLNFIQVDLLRQLRDLTPDAEEYRALMRNVLATVNGISAGMKVTG